MEETMKEEEFYSMISNNLHDLLYTKKFRKSSKQEKKNLWFLIYETAQRYEEQKKIDLRGATEKLAQSFSEMYENIAKLISYAGETLPLLSKTIINVQETKKKIIEIKQKQKSLEKMLREQQEGKIGSIDDIHSRIADVNSTVEGVLKEMKNQSL